MTAQSPALGAPPRGRQRALEVWDILWANKFALLGAILALIFIVIGIVGIIIWQVESLNHLYTDQNLRNNLANPFSGNLLGTDNLGRDVAWRLVAGTGVSLYVGFVVTIATVAIGLVLGTVAGYVRGIVDHLISGLIDLSWGFPVILVAVIFAGIFDPGLTAVILALIVAMWAGFARIIRAEVISLREREFVEAARALGVPPWKIMARHMIPNMIGATLVMASYFVAITVIAEAGLSFIGIGAQPPTPSLGQMVANGRNFFSVNPWVVVVPGMGIALVVLGLNALGDGLRDIFDPRLRRW